MPYDNRAAQPGETVLANARLVLPDEMVRGSVLVRDGEIASIDSGAAVPPAAIDCGGDLLAPGLIELHTDNLERHLEPRPGVHWPHAAAIAAHDAELAGCGITTVFDALRVGSLVSGGQRGYAPYARGRARALAGRARRRAVRISHRLHLRAETCSETLIEELAAFGPQDEVGILSLMDHTPGQRQFRDLATLRTYTRGRRTVSDAEFDDLVADRLAISARFRAAHEAAAVAAARRLGATLASHDDTTPEQVAASARHGSRIAEFPTTLEAARACRDAEIAVMMGAPNLLCGGSHSGHAAAGALAEAGLLDILSSDYVPASLLLAAVRLGETSGDMAAGFATVTTAPAAAAGLADRGRIAPGLRADLVRVRMAGGLPLPRGVWAAGERVA
jgi:alpha-D-ribose 1-methylphosphonate 5-triphosphate diphosphatase